MRNIRFPERVLAARGFLAVLAMGLALGASGCPGKKSETYRVGFNFHLIAMEGDRGDAANRINTMLEVAKSIFKQAKFEIAETQIHFHSGADAQRLTNIYISEDAAGNFIFHDENRNGWPDDMEELMTWSSRTPNKNIDIFLVSSIGEVGILGLAGDIPGPAQKGTARSGIILNTFGGLFQMNAAEMKLQGGTLVHETIHYMGVYHTTESDGLDFDYLKDTPECPQSQFDRNRDGDVSSSECYGQDGQYLMFWQAGNFPQEKISKEQIAVIKKHPLAQKN